MSKGYTTLVALDLERQTQRVIALSAAYREATKAYFRNNPEQYPQEIEARMKAAGEDPREAIEMKTVLQALAWTAGQCVSLCPNTGEAADLLRSMIEGAIEVNIAERSTR